jgi:anti-sigma-K factor RskA
MTSTPDDPELIEHQIDRTQQHLASTVDELAARVAPKALARQGVETAQAKAREAVLAPDGSLRTERVAAVGGAVVAVLGSVIALAVRRKRHDRTD